MSQSQGQELWPLHYCRWNSCRLTFPRSVDLRRHVLDAHVKHARPFPRIDLPLLLRSEEGIGETMSIGIHMTGVSQSSVDQEHSTKTDSSNSQTIEPSSSLPSPPASSPASLSPKARDPTPLPMPIDSQNVETSTPVSHRSFLNQVRTFASLASPTESFITPQIPDSPELGAMIENAVNPKKRRRTESIHVPVMSTGTSTHLTASTSMTSEVSASSTRSQNSVEYQLTQHMDEHQGDDDLEKYLDPECVEDYSPDLRQLQASGSNAYKGEIYRGCSLSQFSPSGVQALSESSQVPSSQSQKSSNSSAESAPPGQNRPRQLQIQVDSASLFPSPSTPLLSPAYSIGTAGVRQAWYSSIPPYSAYLSHSLKRQKPEKQQVSTVSPASLHSSQAPPGRQHIFRSGTLPPLASQTTPPDLRRHHSHSAVEHTPDGGLIHVHRSPDSQHLYHDHPISPPPAGQAWASHHDQPEWLSQSQDVSFTQHSYGPLQTQAPYHSQSMDY